MLVVGKGGLPPLTPEPHGLQEEKHLIDRLNRIMRWFDLHLK